MASRPSEGLSVKTAGSPKAKRKNPSLFGRTGSFLPVQPFRSCRSAYITDRTTPPSTKIVAPVVYSQSRVNSVERYEFTINAKLRSKITNEEELGYDEMPDEGAD